MRPEIQRIDADARLILPNSFANADVIVEQVSNAEVRIRRADAEDEPAFIEESVTTLNDADRDYFLTILEKSSLPSQAMIEAVRRHKARHG